jgi:hypothetical protein
MKDGPVSALAMPHRRQAVKRAIGSVSSGGTP